MTAPTIEVHHDVKFHISGRHADGTLFGYSAADWDEFVLMTQQAVGDENLNAVMTKVKVILTAGSDGPIAAAATAVSPPVQPSPIYQVTGQQGQWGNPPVPPIQQSAPATAPGAPACAHGAMTFRSSKPGAARAWTGYFCPTPKGTVGQCDPIFQN